MTSKTPGENMKKNAPSLQFSEKLRSRVCVHKPSLLYMLTLKNIWHKNSITSRSDLTALNLLISSLYSPSTFVSLNCINYIASNITRIISNAYHTHHHARDHRRHHLHQIIIVKKQKGIVHGLNTLRSYYNLLLSHNIPIFQ